MKVKAQRCLARVLFVLLPWSAVFAFASSGVASQTKTADAPAKTAKEQGAKDPGKPAKGTDPQSGAGKALNRFLQGKKGEKSTQEPKAGKEKKPEEEPEKAAGKKPVIVPVPGKGDGKEAAGAGVKEGQGKAGAQGESPQGTGGPKEDQGKAAAQGLEKFLHGKPKTGEGATGEAGPQAGKEGQDPGPLIPPPIDLRRRLPPDVTAPLSGNLTTWYRFRTSEDDTDQQLIGLLSLDYGDPDLDQWSAQFRGRGAWDMDGNQTGNIFNGILQTYPNAVTGRIYTLFVQGRDLGPIARARLGRQEILETPEPAWIDGLQLLTKEWGRARLRFGGYLGRGVRIFASSDDALSAGLNAEANPWFQGRVRLDWMHVDQRQPVPDIDNNLIGMTYWQGIGEDHQFYSKITSVDGRGRDFILRDTVQFPDIGLQVDISYNELLTTQRRQVVDFDLFTEAAFEYKPYRQIQLHVNQNFTDHFSLAGGIDFRRLKHSSDEGRFNREYDRFILAGSLFELFNETTTFNVTLNRYDSGGEVFDEVSADALYRFLPGWEARLGSTYSLFKWDWVTSQEREHVRTYDVGLTWKPNPTWRFRIRYLLEDDDIGVFHSLRATFSWDF